MKHSSLSEPTHPLTKEPSKPKLKPLCENIFDVPRSGLLDVLETLQEAFWTDEPDPPLYHPSPITHNANLDHDPPLKTTSLADSKISPPILKRQRLNKQATLTSPAGTDYIQPTSPSPPSSPSHDTTALKNAALAIALKKSEQVALKRSKLVALKKSKLVALKKSEQVAPKESVGAAAPPREGRLKLWTVKWLLVKQLKSPPAEYKEKEVMALWQRFQTQGTPTEIRHLANYLYPVAYGMRRYTMAQSLQPLAE
ncbi:hypothetical protein [Absidia glauca]|uniref:Uncharacterized protein n=1 Tax=Absidia glauca TaxID=4829 RepID=A0A168KZT9_ABSGL|nr:hypothetical protein [Absidia glauca]